MTSEQLRRKIKSQMELYGYNSQYMAACICYGSRSGWYRRLKDPDKFTFGELTKLDKVLHMHLING